MFLDEHHRLAYKAIANGGVRRSVVRTEWDVSGRCLSPKVVEIHTRPSPPHRVRRERDILADPKTKSFLAAISAEFGSCTVANVKEPTDNRAEKFVRVGPNSTPPQNLELTVRCRKCDWCREQRRRLWARRAHFETRTAVRTWFMTFTLSPDEHARAHARACQKLSRQGLDFDALDHGEQFRLRHDQIGPLITKWIKRVRKQSGAKLRYLLVAEAHKSGLPHYHMLVHERDDRFPVRKGVLQAQWPHGFTTAKLVSDPRAATYVCKYLAKNAVARVRASARYGEQTYFNIGPQGGRGD